ncbi:unnamed protein product, partial [Cyprideis torosa]
VSLVLQMQSLVEPVADLSGCSSPPQDRGMPLGRPPLRAQPKSRQLQYEISPRHQRTVEPKNEWKVFALTCKDPGQSRNASPRTTASRTREGFPRVYSYEACG